MEDTIKADMEFYFISIKFVNVSFFSLSFFFPPNKPPTFTRERAMGNKTFYGDDLMATQVCIIPLQKTEDVFITFLNMHISCILNHRH